MTQQESKIQELVAEFDANSPEPATESQISSSQTWQSSIPDSSVGKSFERIVPTEAPQAVTTRDEQRQLLESNAKELEELLQYDFGAQDRMNLAAVLEFTTEELKDVGGQ